MFLRQREKIQKVLRRGLKCGSILDKEAGAPRSKGSEDFKSFGELLSVKHIAMQRSTFDLKQKSCCQLTCQPNSQGDFALVAGLRVVVHDEFEGISVEDAYMALFDLDNAILHEF